MSSLSDSRKNLSIGLESTLRQLKRNQLKLLVISDGFTPRWFAQHLVSMALHKNQSTKILIVKNLKEITKNVLKIPSIVFGVKTSEFKGFCEAMQSEFIEHFHRIYISTDVSLKRKKRKLKENEEIPVVLLKKSSISSREFVPMDVDELPESPLNLQNTTGFISFSKFNDSSSSVHTKSPLLSYRPIKIKRIVGNSKRKEKN